ncbi:MAG: ABC transporter ATP-binding protein [Deltaproteobacteria bacterium]|nr:ABC transporter ATP-binding protein [Deltaproteobacteria bacterium]
MSVGVAAGQPLTDSAGPLLEVGGLQAEYGDIPVLWDLSLTVRAGEILALVGANGAGKTTLLRVLSGLLEGFLKVRRGTIRLRGQALKGLDPAEIVARGIAHVPEGRHLFPGLTVLENLKLGGYMRLARADRRASLERVFETLPLLRDRWRQLAGTLSGGEQQLLAIGRALMQRPTLLMLDEPSLGLAPRLVAMVFELVGRIRAGGVTVLLVEQNVRQALALADRGYVLEAGRIVLEGRGGELLEHPKVKRAYLGL